MNWLVFAIITLLVICVNSQAWSDYYAISGSMTLRARVPTSSTIEFEFVCESSGWCGLIYGATMSGYDCFIVTASGGSGTITDRWSSNHNTPSLDTTNDYTLSTVTSGGFNTYTIGRAIVTGDVKDNDFVNGTNTMTYAWGSSSSINDHGSKLGALTMTLDLTALTVTFTQGSLVYDTATGTKHAVLLYFAWGIMSFILIVSGRYSKYFYSFRIYVHAWAGLLVLLFTIIGISSYGSFSRPRESANSLGDKHVTLGGAVITLNLVAVGIGIFTKVMQKFIGRWSVVVKYVRWLHIYSAYAIIIYSHFVYLSGLYYFDSIVTPVFYIHIVFMLIMIAIIEVIFQKNSKWNYSDMRSLKDQRLKKISIEEFNYAVKQGKKYALFDNYVLDLTWFRHEHPAGSFLIEQNIGKDMGKYFVGSYSMEDNWKPYTHSAIAGKILKKLVWAELENPRTPVIIEEKDLDKSYDYMNGLHSLNLIDKPSNVFYVKSKTELIPNVFRFKLVGKSGNALNFYPDLELSGRSFIVRSFKNNVCRYYTICNCMNSKFYDRYINVFKSILGENSYYEEIDYSNMIMQIDDGLEFVAKYYSQTKIGISKQLTQGSPDHRFYVNVPLGKGLDINLHNPQGHYLIFVGGTGILPYMDFFAYLGRQIIAKNSQKYHVFANEIFKLDISNLKVTVYAFHTDPENAIGYQFMTLLDKVFKGLDAGDMFSYRPQFTRLGDQKLSKTVLKNMIAHHDLEEGIDKVWVCGPPPMNNLFYSNIDSISKWCRIKKDAIDVL